MANAFTNPSAQLDFPAFRPEMAFPPLTDTMIEIIRAYASDVTVSAGTTIFARGERGTDMFVILEGKVNIYAGDEANTSETVIDLGDHQFTGELNMLNDQPTLVGARTTVSSVLLRVTRGNLRRLMRAEGEIANLILQAFIWRRIGLSSQAKVGVTLIGHEGEAETLKLQRFLRRNGYPHHVTSVKAYQSASPTSSPDRDSWPAVVFNDGRVLHRPTVSRLADELGISEMPDKSTIYDVAVVGAGPAGLAAAVYASSEGLSTVVIENVAPGGQAGTSSKIENYLGFPTGISGQRLANRAFVQALKFGVRFAVSREALSLEPYSDVHKITLAGGISLCSRAVVIATGVQYRKLPLEFERESQTPISLCANTIRVLSDEPIPETEIPKRTGCSEETAGIGWQHKPYIIVERDPARGRGKFVRLSEAGIKAQQEYYSRTRDIEEKWKKRFRTATKEIQESLTALLKRGKLSDGLNRLPERPAPEPRHRP